MNSRERKIMKKFKVGEMYSIPYGTLVKADLGDKVILGKVVGKCGTEILQTHIIQCIDSQIPTDDYPYDTFIASLQCITAFGELD